MASRARLSALPLILAALAGCSDPAPIDPRCSDGRSRCVAQASLGAHFGCALLRDRTVWCWGRNDESQLGYPTTDLCPEELPSGETRAVACHAFPFQVVGLDRATAVAAGGAFACAIRTDGTLRCWGSNASGQLGNGQTLPGAAPTPVDGLAEVTAVAAGARHACAVAGGRVFCWGANDRGQLGQTTSNRACRVGGTEIPCETSPRLVQTLETVVAIAAGDAHTCARTSDGLVFCWGDNRYGQLGIGRATATPLPYPQAVLDGELPMTRIEDLSVGGSAACARDIEGAVRCWGDNREGQLGLTLDGPVPTDCAGPCATRPVQVPSLEFRPRPPDLDGAVDASLDASADASLDGTGDVPDDLPTDATKDAGAPSDDVVRDAGRDAGRDARVDAAPPTVDVQVVGDDATPSGPPRVPRGIAAGGSFACAPLEDGTVRCWGANALGQLGDGRRAEVRGPVMVIATPGAAATNPLQRVTSVVTGTAVACALLTDGSLRCWGSNRSGGLGIGATSVQAGPVPVGW